MENKTLIINFADTTKLPSSNIELEPLQINKTTPIFFIGENTRYYGKFVMQSMLSLLEHFASSVPPLKPIEGMLWFDLVENVLKVAYIHTPYIPATDETEEELPILRWREVGLPHVSELIHRLPPGNLLWYNTDDGIVYIQDIDDVDTATWKAVGENFLPLSGTDTSQEYIRGNVTLQDLLTVGQTTTVSGLFTSSNVRATNSVKTLSDAIIGTEDEFSSIQFDYTGSLTYGITTLSLTNSVLLLSDDYFDLTAKTLKFNTYGAKESYFEAENDTTESYFKLYATSYIDFNNKIIENCKYSSFDFSASPPVYIDDDIAVTKGILDDFIAVHNTIGSNTELLITGDAMDSATTLSVDGDIIITNNVAQPANITFQDSGVGCNVNTLMVLSPGIRFTPYIDSVYDHSDIKGMLHIQSVNNDAIWWCKPDTIIKHIPDPSGSPLNMKQACNRKYAEDKAGLLESLVNKNEKGKIKGSVRFRLGKTGDSVIVDDASSYNVTVQHSSTKHTQIPIAPKNRPEDWIYGKTSDFAVNPVEALKVTTSMKGNIEPSIIYAVYKITFNDNVPSDWWSKYETTKPPIGTIISSSIVDTSDDVYTLSTNDNVVSLFNYEAVPYWESKDVPVVYIYVSINYNFMLPLNLDGFGASQEVDRIIQQFRSRLPYNYYSTEDDQFFFNEGPKQIFKFKKSPRIQEMWRWDDGANSHKKLREFVDGYDYYKIFPGRGQADYGKIEIHIGSEYKFDLDMNAACDVFNNSSGWNKGITYIELIYMLNHATQNMIQSFGSTPPVEYKNYFVWRFSVDYPDYQAIECIYIGPDPELMDVKIIGNLFFSPFTNVYEGPVYDENTFLPKPPAKYLDAIFFW